jgi:ribose-phosphate pyrophosphokinase
MSKYSDGEFQPSYEESIRGICICLFHFSNSDNLMELLLMIDAAKRASAARHITAVIPYSVGQGRIEKTSPEFR